MCGRTCLTLEPDQVLCACRFKPTTKAVSSSNKSKENVTVSGTESKYDEQLEKLKTEETGTSQCYDDEDDDDDFVLPDWRAEYNNGRKYTPSYNIAPSEITPVLVSNDHFIDNADPTADPEAPSRAVVPMLWGMIPFWHKGDYRKHGLTTNNCRLEHMKESKLYNGPFRRGQRCVVLCEGFYEWQTTKSAKPSEREVNFLYMPQAENVKIHDKTTWTPENVNLLKMAGLFDVWEDGNGDKMYSYSVITFESSNIMSWLHHRMPAILETEQQVDDWLDYKRVPHDKALEALRPTTKLKYHRVSNYVNYARNKTEQCNKPAEDGQALTSSNTTPKSKTMMSWLNTRKRREELANLLSDDDSSPLADAATTSESEAESAPKRPRYRDYKKQVREQKASSTTTTTASANNTPTVDGS